METGPSSESGAGAANLTINNISLGGTNPTEFTVTSNTCGPYPATVVPAGSCTVGVAFNPVTTGSKTASLTVAVAGPAVSQAVTLSGTGQ